MKNDIIWTDICWDSFEYFAELYKPLPKMSGTDMAVLSSRIEDVDKQNGGNVNYQDVRRRQSMRDLKEKCIISGTSSPEL